MLNDTRRKILRILVSMHRHEWHYPDIEELCTYAQHETGVVRKAIVGLRWQGYVEIRGIELRVLAARTDAGSAEGRHR